MQKKIVCIRSFLVLAALSWAMQAAAAGPSPKTTLPQASKVDASQYVGEDTCKTCHDDLAKSWEHTAHYRTLLDKNAGPDHKGCEGCHGPGKAHVDGGGDITKIISFKKLTPKQASDRCLTCHSYGSEHANYRTSTHADNEVGCLSCHSPHHAKVEHALLTDKQPALCYGCHAEQKADFQKTFRHRVDEGLILCSDCHNAHGTLRDRQVRSTPNQDLICLKCHSDKRGPFVFEHEPVRVEGCTTCHTPHASVYPRMLLTARINTLCLQCHEQIPVGVHGPQNQYRQSCIVCHNSIHGSNTSNLFFR